MHRFQQRPLLHPIHLVVQAVVCHLLADVDQAEVWRAAELLFRRQRITVEGTSWRFNRYAERAL